MLGASKEAERGLQAVQRASSTRRPLTSPARPRAGFLEAQGWEAVSGSHEKVKEQADVPSALGDSTTSGHVLCFSCICRNTQGRTRHTVGAYYYACGGDRSQSTPWLPHFQPPQGNMLASSSGSCPPPARAYQAPANIAFLGVRKPSRGKLSS